VDTVRQNTEKLSELLPLIDEWSRELGFQDWGIADLDIEHYVARLDDWLAKGFQADMGWIADRRNLRAYPDQLVEGTVRVISLRMDYQPPDTEPLRILKSPEKAYVSRYALGRDYHKVIRARLAKLAEKINAWASDELASNLSQRVFVDSAPVMEKPMAEKAGIGWIGKNTLILNRNAGSWFFLGEIYTNLPLPVSEDQPEDECGKCKACLNICPTNAFPEPYVLDASKCISYLTIENSGPIPTELRSKMGNRVFGCDDCQLVCPWNRFASTSGESDFRPRHQLDDSELADLFKWTEAEFLDRTAGSPIRRAGYDGWRRNLAVGLGNGPASQKAINALKQARPRSSMVREHVEWALEQLTEKSQSYES
jgi:epoxyqueuosine reductase